MKKQNEMFVKIIMIFWIYEYFSPKKRKNRHFPDPKKIFTPPPRGMFQKVSGNALYAKSCGIKFLLRI